MRVDLDLGQAMHASQNFDVNLAVWRCQVIQLVFVSDYLRYVF